MWIFILLPVLFATVTSSFCPTVFRAENETRADANYRLPNEVKPTRYILTLEPDLRPNLNPATFKGEVTIEFTALKSTQNITIHANQIKVTDNKLTGHDSPINIVNLDEYPENHFLFLILEKKLTEGQNYTLNIKYTGILNLQNSGFYLGKYWDENGKEKRMATTQFQSIGARKAFPCFDEPHLKAKFQINLIRTKDFNSISNEEMIDSQILDNERIMDVYKETVPMSTYLAAFIVSEYGSTKKKDIQRIFGIKNKIDDGQANYALDVGIKILKALEDYFDIKYALSKMDQVAIPDEYFSPGAMENWGLVTYKDYYLVYPFDKATLSEIQGTVTIIGHEFAHQWFGNLVTCSRWKYLWLNEGFANYFQHYISSVIEPTWRLMDQFVLNSVQSALKSDMSIQSTPMNYESAAGSGPSSYIAYQKAGSVIRMFEHFLTHDIFQKGLRSHLNNKKYEPVEPSDLYQRLQEEVDRANKGVDLLNDLKVKDILTTWDSQAGYPVVEIVRNYDSGSLVLTQTRFLEEGAPEDKESVWHIPINYVLQSDKTNEFEVTTAKLWFINKEKTFNNFETGGWIVANKKANRVNYDKTNWDRITGHLINNEIDNIHLINRAQLIDDSFTFAKNGKIKFEIPLNLTKYLIKETDYVPLTSFLNAINFLKNKIYVFEEYYIFEIYVQNSLNAAYKALGFDEQSTDEHLDKFNRIRILTWLCNLGNIDCKTNADEKFKEFKSDKNAIVPNLESPIFCGAMASAVKGDWDLLYSEYERAGNTSRATRILASLACSQNEEVLNEYLKMIIDENSSIKKEHRTYAFTAIANRGLFGLNTSFNFLSKNFDACDKQIGIPNVLNLFGNLFVSQEQLGQLEDLAKAQKKYELYFNSAIAETKKNMAWNNKYSGEIREWLIYYTKLTNTGTSATPVVILIAATLSAIKVIAF